MKLQYTGVIEYINENFVPLRLNWQASKDILNRYRILWAPIVLVLDSNGIKYYSFNVFLPPDKFIPQLEFGLGKLALKMQGLKKVELRGETQLQPS